MQSCKPGEVAESLKTAEKFFQTSGRKRQKAQRFSQFWRSAQLCRRRFGTRTRRRRYELRPLGNIMTREHRRPGRHFLQIPGPTPVPERILAAMSRQMLDHRGLEFAQLGRRVLSGIKALFKTQGPVIIYPSSGTGAWEAGLTNTLSSGDKVLMCETGQFAVLWEAMARRLGLETE